MSFDSSIQKLATVKTQKSAQSNKKQKTKKERKKSDKFFFLIFRIAKNVSRGCRQHCQRPLSVFGEDEAEEATKKKIQIKNLLKFFNFFCF